MYNDLNVVLLLQAELLVIRVRPAFTTPYTSI